MNRGHSGRSNPRFQSPGIQTPARRMQTEFPEEEFDFSSPIFSEQLQKRLEDLESSGDGTTKTEFMQSIGILESDRRKTATEGREKALHSVLDLLSNKYEPALMSQELFATIYNELISARSEVEVILSTRLVIVALASFDDHDPHLADCLERVKARLLSLLLERAKESDEEADAYAIPARAAMVTCYAVLQFLLNVGGGGFGVEEMINELLEIAEGTKDAEAPIATAAIQGVGLLSVIVSQGTAIVLMPELSISLEQFLGSQNPDLSQAAAKTAGVLFEKCYTSPDSLQGAEELIEALETMANESSKRIAKRDKKSRKSVARDVLVTARAPDHEEDEDYTEDRVLTHFRLSPTRSLMVKSWSVLCVIQHLRWVFGPGLYTHLANNPTLVSVLHNLAEEGKAGEIDFDFKEDTINEQEEALQSSPRAQKRDIDIRKARLEKVNARDLQ